MDRNFTPEVIDTLDVSPEDMNSDLHATSEYRASLVKTMAKRAVQQLTD